MLVLGIESSCDETAAALVEDGRRILSSVVASQDDVHGKYGGVVPELASRKHIVSILEVIETALSRAGVKIGDVNGIAVTRGPGLIGSLLVGLSTAKALGYAEKIPFVGVHHIEGHLTAALLGAEPGDFPLVGLVASGGHTSLYQVPAKGTYKMIAQSRDDAAGEAFDKVAKLLGLPYPGGVEIDRLAASGNPKAHDFPQALQERENLDFSFSGLKTSVRDFLEKNPDLSKSEKGMADLCASVRHAIVGVLLRKTEHAVEKAGVSRVALSGGVAANRALREGITNLCTAKGWEIHLPAPELATDNAAMMAFAAMHHLRAGASSQISQEITPQWQVGKK